MTIFLPILVTLQLARFGLDVSPPLQYRLDACHGIEIISFGNLLWSKWEPERGQYDQEYIAETVDAITRIQAIGAEPLIILHGTPEWAALPGAPAQVVANPADFAAFFRYVTATLPGVREYQLYQEVDSTIGTPDYYGLWGAEWYSQYAAIVTAAKQAAPQAALSIGLMNVNASDLTAFKQLGVFDDLAHVNVHHYASYGAPDNVAEIGAKAALVRQYANLPVWLTEANLLSDTTSEAYERLKAHWLYTVWDTYKQDMEVIMFYGWKSWWRNANVYPLLPAWDTVEVIMAEAGA